MNGTWKYRFGEFFVLSREGGGGTTTARTRGPILDWQIMIRTCYERVPRCLTSTGLASGPPRERPRSDCALVRPCQPRDIERNHPEESWRRLASRELP